jgi:hypothetical protein
MLSMKLSAPTRRRSSRTANWMSAALVPALLLGAADIGRASCTTSICTGGNPCTISGTHTIDDGCILDFGSSQDVIITGTMQTANTDEWFEIRAHYIDVNGGVLRAKGWFGSVGLTTSGSGDPYIKTRSSALIDTSDGGTTVIDAAGAVEITGGSGINADGGDPYCDGGSISISGASVLITKTVHADGAGCEEDGAGGTIEIAATAGSVTLSGNGAVTVNAGGNDYDGGTITIDAGTTISQGKVMQAKGIGHGSGGWIWLTSSTTGTSGLITVSDATTATGGSGEESAGGWISIDGGAATTTGALNVNGNYYDGGYVDVFAAGGDILIDDTISADGSSGGYGGLVQIFGDRHVTVDAQVTANGGGSATIGGTVRVTAGTNHTLSVESTVEAKATNGGSSDGSIILGPACDISVSGAVRTRNTAVGGGENRLIYLGTATVTSAGSLLADDPAATNCAAAAGSTNGNIIECRCPDSNSDGMCDSSTCVSSPTLSGTVTPTALICPKVLPACG